MRKLLLVMLALSALVGLAEEEPRRIAVFVQNRTRVPGMDDEVDGIRDRLAAALAEVDGFAVLDSAQVADSFRQHKVTTEEEKRGLVAGIFAGGSIPAIARMIGCDYIVAASVVSASSLRRNVGGTMATVFSLRMSLKVMDATGASVYGLPVKPYTFPATDVVDDPMNYYNILLDRWATEATAALAQRAPKWRKAAPAETALVSFTVQTTIDQSLAELESQTKGAQGEQLAELRKVVGGVTVELDGAVIGSTPNTFRATPGLHQLRVTREWMKPYQATVSLQDGMTLQIALELSAEGAAKW
ncbi:MAG: PEGA domain-containing protein, partial [Kiritimatiellia bacterium]